MKNKILSLIAFVLLLVLSSCGSKEKAPEATPEAKPLEVDKVVAIGRIEPETKITQIGSEVSGIVRRVYHQAGDTVKKGELLIEIVDDYESAKLSSAQSKIQTFKADIQATEEQLQIAKIKVANLNERLARLTKIVAQGADTKQNLDNLQAEVDQAKRDVSRLQAVIETAKSRVNEGNADIRLAATDIDRRKIKAPVDGLILTMDVTEGSAINVQGGKSLFDFAPLSPLTVLCEVDELFANSIKVGQKATIRNPGMTDVIANGTVIFAGPYLKKKSLFSEDSGNMEDRRVREVRIRLADGNDLLINGRVEAVISLK